MKFRMDAKITGVFFENNWCQYDKDYDGEGFYVDEIGALPFDIEDGKQFFDKSLTVVKSWSEFSKICHPENGMSGDYECEYKATIEISVKVEAQDSEKASEKAWALIDEFLKIEEDLGLENIDEEEIRTFEETAENERSGEK